MLLLIPDPAGQRRIDAHDCRADILWPRIEAGLNRDSVSIEYLHNRMIETAVKAGRFEDALSHIIYLEKRSAPIPSRPVEYRRVILSALGRADIARAQARWKEAIKYYRRALFFCEQEPSNWLAANTLNLLGELEWKTGNAKAAKAYLERGRKRTEPLDLHDLLTRNYELQARIAETEARYADALVYMRKQYFHQSDKSDDTGEKDPGDLPNP